MGCFYCDEHHEGREAIMFKVGEMKAGVLYLFKDQAHKGRCALALKAHKKELCECTDQERADFAEDLAKASGAIKELWGCTKLNLGSFGDTNPHLHFHIVPKYEGGFEFGFSAQRALSRNRFIHAMGEKTLVAQTSFGKGGTWNGSLDNLQHEYSPLFVFDDGSEGARALCARGATPVQALTSLQALTPAQLSFDMQ